MSDIWSTWLMWLAIAVVVIAIAAVLLLLVNQAAQRILHLAVAALGLVQDIKANTGIIWALEDTNKTALKILNSAESIKANGAAVAQALHEADVKRGV